MLDFKKKYRPKTLREFVGRQAVTTARKLLQHRPGKIALVEDFGRGKTSMARLMAKAHFCVSPEDYGPCGCCHNCLGFEDRWDAGEGMFALPESEEMGWFQVYDFTDVQVDQIKRVRRMISPFSQQPDLIWKSHPEVLVFDEAHRAAVPNQELLLKPLETEVLSSLLFCMARDNLSRVIKPLTQRLYPFELGQPETEELLPWVQRIIEGEGMPRADTSAMVELIEGCRQVPRDILRGLEEVAMTNAMMNVSVARRITAKIRSLEGTL